MTESSNMIYPDNKLVGRYSAIGNEVLEKLADIELTKEGRKVLTRIIQDTIGYEQGRTPDDKYSIRRVTQEITIERFEEKTGL